MCPWDGLARRIDRQIHDRFFVSTLLVIPASWWMPLPTLRRVSKKGTPDVNETIKSGKSPRTFHAEGESLSTFNRYGSSVNMHFL